MQRPWRNRPHLGFFEEDQAVRIRCAMESRVFRSRGSLSRAVGSGHRLSLTRISEAYQEAYRILRWGRMDRMRKARSLPFICGISMSVIIRLTGLSGFAAISKASLPLSASMTP